MLKIRSGEIIEISPNSPKNSYFAYGHSVLLTLCGKVFFDGEDSSLGEGVFLRAGRTVECAPSDEESVFLRIELDGYDDEQILKKQSLTSSMVKISCVAADRILRALAALFDDGYCSQSEELDRAVARVLLLSIHAQDSEEEMKTGNEYVDRAVRYIDRNYASRIRVESLADMLELDRMYLRNLFTEHLGMSTMEYIMGVRMTRAKELLENTEISVGDVAAAVGYTDVLCFSKAFKKRVGASPTEYRLKGKAEKAEQEKRSSRREQIPVFIL